MISQTLRATQELRKAGSLVVRVLLAGTAEHCNLSITGCHDDVGEVSVSEGGVPDLKAAHKRLSVQQVRGEAVGAAETLQMHEHVS